VADSAVLSFVTALGTIVGVVIPAFKEALYLADNQTVDPAQPLVIAVIAAAIALPVVDGSGNAAIAYIGGLRQKRGY
jgi:anaerobic C4-dicarboxylate transporter